MMLSFHGIEKSTVAAIPSLPFPSLPLIPCCCRHRHLHRRCRYHVAVTISITAAIFIVAATISSIAAAILSVAAVVSNIATNTVDASDTADAAADSVVGR
jgi:hypothetical protein